MVIKVAFGSEHEDIGLDTHRLQLLDTMLCGLGLQFVGSLQIRHIGQVYTYGITSQLPPQLSDGFHERRTLNVADGTAHLCDDKVEGLPRPLQGEGRIKTISPSFGGIEGGSEHPPFNLIRDVWHHLDGLAQIVSTAFAVDDGLVDTTCCYRVVSCCMYACKALVVPQVEIGLETVLRHVALAVLVGVQRARVNVDIGVELLNGDLVAACLQQFTDRGGNDALSQ